MKCGIETEKCDKREEIPKRDRQRSVVQSDRELGAQYPRYRKLDREKEGYKK